MNPINRTKVDASPLYLRCYHPDSPFQICQAYHPLSVAGASSGSSHPSLALMDPSLLLRSSKSNDSSSKQTNLIEHMILSTQRCHFSKRKQKSSSFFPSFWFWVRPAFCCSIQKCYSARIDKECSLGQNTLTSICSKKNKSIT